MQKEREDGLKTLWAELKDTASDNERKEALAKTERAALHVTQTTGRWSRPGDASTTPHRMKEAYSATQKTLISEPNYATCTAVGIVLNATFFSTLYARKDVAQKAIDSLEPRMGVIQKEFEDNLKKKSTAEEKIKDIQWRIKSFTDQLKSMGCAS